MLKTQNFLHEHSLAELADEFAIRVIEHPEYPLVILNYNQINSPKYEAIVKECRGLVLEKGSWKVVAKGFDRFFNWGEGEIVFDWNKFEAFEKADGTLCILYHYAGRWFVNTRQTFNLAGERWYDLFWATAEFDEADLDPALTYCFELCTPENVLVTQYETPRVYLLSVFDKEGRELDHFPPELNPIPRHNLYSPETIKDFIEYKEKTQPDFEGLVLRDRKGTRLKVKSKTYLNYHHLFDNGQVMQTDRLVPLLMAGEGPALMNIFPAYSGRIATMSEVVNEEFNKLGDLWKEHGDLPQKEFALTILPRTKFSFLLFAKKNRPEEELEDIWFDQREKVAKKFVEHT